jgi:luciferase family oxidoreductase group 1
LGYHRYWLVEHHNTGGVAGAATAVIIGQVAGATRTIRVGAGGIMLPNHAPLMVAEQFGTLEALYPGRIDLGLGRGLPHGAATLKALRRAPNEPDTFAADVQELLGYLGPVAVGAAVRAVPGQGSNVPVWILGASLGGAALAAQLGLPFAFASHFAPDQLEVALAAYRGRFVPSRQCERPHVMLAIGLAAADTDTQAELLFTSTLQASDGPLPPPIAGYEQRVPPQRLALIRNALRHTLVGGPDKVAKGLQDFIARYRPDEIIVADKIFDHAARLRAFEILSRCRPD